MIPNLAWLFYGGPGSGKTAGALSSFWDWRAQIRDGRWLRIGRESNSSLNVPDELVKRFTPPSENPIKFMDEMTLYFKAARLAARKQGHPEVYVMDGWTEWNALFLSKHYEQFGDTGWKRFQEAKDRFFQLVQFLDPEEMDAHIITTARITRWKKPLVDKSGKELAEGDQDWQSDFKYFPAMDGWARDNLSHYFSMVIYVDQDPGLITVNGRQRQGVQHKYYMLPSGDFWVKNWWEWQWLQSGKPDYLVNPMFDDIVEALNQVKGA